MSESYVAPTYELVSQQRESLLAIRASWHVLVQIRVRVLLYILPLAAFFPFTCVSADNFLDTSAQRAAF